MQINVHVTNRPYNPDKYIQMYTVRPEYVQILKNTSECMQSDLEASKSWKCIQMLTFPEHSETVLGGALNALTFQAPGRAEHSDYLL